MLRFANQPRTAGTGRPTRDGHDSTGEAIRVEIYDPATNRTVDTDADVTLTLGLGSARGKLIGGTAKAVAGVATFPDLSIDTPGLYTLKAGSATDSDTPLSDGFMVADTVATCDGPGCSFRETREPHTYTATPEQGSAGARWASSVNLPGVRISCDFAPFDYPDERQPNTIWYSYDDGDTRSPKTIVIVIDKAIVDTDAGQWHVRLSGRLFVTGALHRPHGRAGQAGSLGRWSERILRDHLVHRAPPGLRSERSSGAVRPGMDRRWRQPSRDVPGTTWRSLLQVDLGDLSFPPRLWSHRD